MYNRLFSSGETVDLAQMLDAREQRQACQMSYLNKYQSHTLISVTMNIPGPIKTNAVLEQHFTNTYHDLLVLFQPHIKTQTILYKITGTEAYLIVDLPSEEVKRQTIAYEETSVIGRLFDIDVLKKDKDGLLILSRTSLGFPKRKCFVCEKTAKECARSQSHSLVEVYDSICVLLQKKEEIAE